MQNETRRCAAHEDDLCLCSIEGIMGILSKKWALLIISAIGNNQKLRYSELEKKLGEISPKTLADRLKELGDAGLIKRETFAEIPPRVEYSLTKEGAELRDAMSPLMKWVASKDFHKGKNYIKLLC